MFGTAKGLQTDKKNLLQSEKAAMHKFRVRQ